jgi:hypothetical protein
MKLAKCNVWLNPGHHVAKENITPAEALILRHIHSDNAGTNAVQDVEETGETPDNWNNIMERGRLMGIYKKDLVMQLFPGAMPQLPKTFEELAQISTSDVEESEYFMESGGRMPGAPPKRGDE